ncbi:hypothetical protein OQ615_25275, partial [Escherichia coli]|nr:hypothetical protein [Escherichia coli]
PRGVLKARLGLDGAKNAYSAFLVVRRAYPPRLGFSGRQDPRPPPAKPICTVQAATGLVGGRRPSVLPRGGVWGSPQTVSGCAQGAAGGGGARGVWCGGGVLWGGGGWGGGWGGGEGGGRGWWGGGWGVGGMGGGV